MSEIPTRRDILRAGGVSLAALTVVGVGIKGVENASVKGLEILGQDGSIGTKADFDQVYLGIRQKFNEELPFWKRGAPSWEQRDSYWGAGNRTLEVVVPKRIFSNDPLSSNFTHRMQQQVDLLNRVGRESGLNNMNFILRRIIVVGDDFTQHPAFLDFSPDVDHSEFIGDETKEDQAIYNIVGGSNGKVSIVTEGGQTIDLSAPTRTDSLTGIGQIRLSTYTTHELWHRLANTGDLSIFDFNHNKTPGFMFRNYQIDENLNGLLSPFSVAHILWNEKYGIRGSFHPLSSLSSQENITTFLWQLPRNSTFEFQSGKNTNLYIPEMLGGYYPNKNAGGVDKLLKTSPDISNHGNNVVLPKERLPITGWHEPIYVLNGNPVTTGHDIPILPTFLVIKSDVEGKPVEVNLPLGAMILSKIVGGLDNPTFQIETFNNGSNEGWESLHGDFVYENKVDVYLENLSTRGGVPYAKVKIPGTQIFYLWFFVDNAIPLKRFQMDIPDQTTIDRSNTQQAPR